MGLASSQARMLSLTSRQHQVEYEAQRIEAQKLQLANESDTVYNKYLDALDATKIQYKIVADDGATMYRDASFANLATAGFLFNVNGTICNSYESVKEALKDQGVVDLTAGDSYALVTNLISEGYVVLMEQQADPEAGWSFEGGKIVFTDDSTNPATTTEYSINGAADKNFTTIIDDKAVIYKVFGDTSTATSTKVQEVSDEVGLKLAEAEYEAAMNKINAKDTRYDNELSQLETERNAIKTEIETLQNVAKDNVDRTFKIFG